MAWIGGEGLRPFVHGAPFVAVTGDTVRVYRLDPDDGEHPPDLWAHAPQPAGVRLEFRAWGPDVGICLRYLEAAQLPVFGAQRQVSLWTGTERVALLRPEQPSGDQELSFDLPVEGARYACYLPYLCQAEIVGIRTSGRLEPVAASGPRWVAYGDSITHGWCATDPALAYPAIASRAFGLEHVNLGFSGTARGEPSAARTIAALPADVISLAFGTNIYKSDQHVRSTWQRTFATFLDIVRAGHPDTPILVVTPIYRGSLSPDDHLPAGVFEQTPSGTGLLHEEIRAAEVEVVSARIQDGDSRLELASGLDIIGMGDAEYLADGIHPSDAGHERMATAIGARVSALAAGPIRTE